MLQWFRKLICRHVDELTAFDGSRMYLVCMRCGRESDGWTIERPVSPAE